MDIELEQSGERMLLSDVIQENCYGVIEDSSGELIGILHMEPT